MLRSGCKGLKGVLIIKINSMQVINMKVMYDDYKNDDFIKPPSTRVMKWMATL